MKNRIFGLDILRSIAIIMVVIEHGSSIRYFGAKMGTLGVELFFVLSGFLIGQILFRDFNGQTSFKTLFNFWKRRWIRTIPVYYLVLFLKFLLLPTIGWNILYYMFFMQNNFYGIDFFGVSWSLVIEEWFYLLIPLGLYLFIQSSKYHQLKVPFYILLVLIIINLLRVLWISKMNTPFGGIVGQFPLRLDTMMVGVAMAYIKLNHKKVFVFLSKPISFIVAILIFHIYVYFWGQATLINTLDESFWFRTGHFITLSISIAILLPFLDSNRKLNELNTHNIFRKLITWISLISYSLYLTHTDIAVIVQKISILKEFNLDNYIFAMFLAFGFSSLLYFYFEKPILKLRDKFKPTP